MKLLVGAGESAPYPSPTTSTTYIVRVESDAKTIRQQRRDYWVAEMDAIKKIWRRIFKKGEKNNAQQQPPQAPPKNGEAQRQGSWSSKKQPPPRKSEIMPHALRNEDDAGAKTAPAVPDEASLTGAVAGPSTERPYIGEPRPERSDGHWPPQPRADGSRIKGKSEDTEQSRASTGPSTDAVSALTEDGPPAPPPKVDGAADAVQAAPMEAATAAPAGEASESEDHRCS
jgi:hypothetical protein